MVHDDEIESMLATVLLKEQPPPPSPEQLAARRVRILEQRKLRHRNEEWWARARERRKTATAGIMLRQQAAQFMRVADLLEAAPGGEEIEYASPERPLNPEQPSARSEVDAQTVDVLMVVCAAYGVTVDAIRGRRRTARVNAARQVAEYLLRLRIPDMSYPAIGRVFGRHHSSVIHNRDLLERRIKQQPGLGDFISGLLLACSHDDGEGRQ